MSGDLIGVDKPKDEIRECRPRFEDRRLDEDLYSTRMIASDLGVAIERNGLGEPGSYLVKHGRLTERHWPEFQRWEVAKVVAQNNFEWE